MHIPDGYLSPQTYIPLYSIFVGVMAVAIKKVKQKLSAKLVPFLGMASAFSFLIMMFNFPIPGGTTGHAVGAALIALLLGPWVAIISVSVALILQALVFGDGGITALGANCFNMAIVMPFVAYFVFILINGKSTSTSRMGIAAFMAGYLSSCAAAFITSIEFGIQPLIAVAANGQPLYCPYPLKIAVPIMTIEHLLFFGPIEGIVTAVIFRYIHKNQPEIIEALK